MRPERSGAEKNLPDILRFYRLVHRKAIRF